MKTQPSDTPRKFWFALAALMAFLSILFILITGSGANAATCSSPTLSQSKAQAAHLSRTTSGAFSFVTVTKKIEVDTLMEAINEYPPVSDDRADQVIVVFYEDRNISIAQVYLFVDECLDGWFNLSPDAMAEIIENWGDKIEQHSIEREG